MIAATFAIIGTLALIYGTIKPWRVVVTSFGGWYVRWGIRWDRIVMALLGTILLICALAVM